MRNVANVFNKVFSTKGFAILPLLALTAPFLNASSVSANTIDIGNCLGYKVCLYENKDFGGASLHVVPGYVPLCVDVGPYSNRVSSLVNNTPHEIRYFEFAGCNGNVGCYFDDGPYDYRRNLAIDRFDNTNQHCASLSPEDRIGSFFLFP